jgi:uncharacterized membrane protein YkoI
LGETGVQQNRRLLWLTAAAAMIAAAAALPAAASRDAGFVPEHLLRVDKRDQDTRRSPRDEAAERARRDTGARVLSIQEKPRDDRKGYRVKILTPEGEVRWYDVDPNNGRGRR